MAELKQRLRAEFPTVQQLSVTDFVRNNSDALLVDVREAEEFAVSRIPGAINISDPEQLLTLAQTSKRPLILYCSVGYRSSKAAAFLAQQGVSAVANLEGSIFEWANQGRLMEDDEGSTQAVHPFNAWWGWRYLIDHDRDAPTAIQGGTK